MSGLVGTANRLREPALGIACRLNLVLGTQPPYSCGNMRARSRFRHWPRLIAQGVSVAPPARRCRALLTVCDIIDARVLSCTGGQAAIIGTVLVSWLSFGHDFSAERGLQSVLLGTRF